MKRAIAALVVLFILPAPLVPQTPTGDPNQTIVLKVKPDGVRVEVLANGKRIAEATSPGTLVFPRAFGYVFRFSKPGYFPKTVKPSTIELGSFIKSEALVIETELVVTLEPLESAEP